MKHKVLIIDDEAAIRKTIRLQLEGTIYDVLEAEDGEKGIHVLDNENILEVVVIICDVRMPKLNGIEAVAYFHENYAGIPIIVLTGYPDVQLAVDFMKGGVVDYLVKPVEKDKLVEAVGKAARQHTLFSGSQQPKL
ncbi:MAG: response regulator [Proteobacteria bacterium]|nr:response regulator [Pseudomonadota bacterium]